MKSIAAPLAALLAALPACGGGGSGGSDAGALTVALTDAASLELASLRLDVTGVQLRKSSGQFVPALAGPLSVELVSLQDSSRVLCLTALSAGKYTHVALSFDLSTARAYIAGHSTPAAVLDWDGNPHPPALTVPVHVSGDLRIHGGRHRLLEVDFDLDQSVRVDQASNTIFIEPALLFRIEPPDPRDMQVMGRLSGVKGNRLALALEDRLGTPLGTVKAVVAADCVYQIDGVPLTGATGLAALAGMPLGTPVQAHGRPSPGAPSFAVACVEAGTGTYEGGLDIAEGHVTGRTGAAAPTLAVFGGTGDASHTVFTSGAIVTVTTDPFETGVVPLLTATPISLDDLNVGQRLAGYGLLNGTLLEAGLPDSVVRVMPARLFGLALGPPSGGNLVIDLEQVDIQSEAAFQWSEGGATPLDPDALVAAVGSLADDLGIGAGTPVELRGSFAPVDEDLFDFSATSAANLEGAPALLLLQDRPLGAGVSVSVAPGQLQITLLGVLGPNEFAAIDRGYLGSTALVPPVLLTATGDQGHFLIRERATWQTVATESFDELLIRMRNAINLGGELFFFGARGAFDEVTSTMQVTAATAVMD
jgi:hypothetical protein